MKQVMHQFNDMYYKYIPDKYISEIKHHDGTVLEMQVELKKIIDLMLSNPVIRKYIQNPEELVPIIRGDAFPCGGKQCLLICVTLANFGPLCNLKMFNFVSNWGYISDKDAELVKQVWGSNLELLNQITENQRILLESNDKSVICHCKYSGDEAWFRMVNGLASSSSNFIILET